ncbi:MAG: DUF4430 domain-containing protein [Candidatus Aureabacteria bacterium]|nr:DUF4430 domain-containing protein [Candidatus Auribacterota bacterium]
MLIYILLLALAITPVPPTAVTLRATRDFGSPPLIEQRLEPAGRSVMELLNACAKVETAFGSGFVRAINGIGDDAGRAWFYYVNGMLADVGAGRYIPAAGESIWWDYHPCDGPRVQALIGCYPEPFRSARDGVRIYFSPGCAASSSILVDSLNARGIRHVGAHPVADIGNSASTDSLVIGGWPELSKTPFISGLYRDRFKLGMCAEFTESGITAYELSGRPGRTIPRGGAILAIGAGAPRRAFWLVTGTDDAVAREAAAILAREPERIRGMASALLVGGAIISLPPGEKPR